MKLIIIHGPPGVGKSSVSELIYNKSQALSCLVKFDVQRRYLKDRHDNPIEAAELAHKICLNITDSCLENKHDVIFDRAIKNSEDIESMINIGEKYNAKIYEIFLWADKETILRRNVERPDAKDGLSDSKRVTPTKAEEFWNKINLYKDNRKNAHIIDTQYNNLNEVIKIVNKIITN